MKSSNIIRSPFFYVGDKYKLMPQLEKLMPQNAAQYIEPFVGGGSSFLNSKEEGICSMTLILMSLNCIRKSGNMQAVRSSFLSSFLK